MTGLPFTAAGMVQRDAGAALAAYRALAPWCLRDLVALASAILEASDVVPVNAAARARPTERTVRFYVSRALVDSPDGRGTAAVYGYRHLLQVLAIKLRQMEGVTLEVVARELRGADEASLASQVAEVIGPALPEPVELGGLDFVAPARGRAGRVLQGPAPSVDSHGKAVLVRRVSVAPGLEFLVEAGHPLFRMAGAERLVAEAITRLVDDLMAGRTGVGQMPSLHHRRGG